ncbi:S8 family serine peptidase [Streptosporangium sp. NPDC020072]|uniref:S8 family serine peptidase n=1 Tax=Streptosporangium sp. NPDC020072 TaxID=3154788 RepID=UPI003439058D
MIFGKPFLAVALAATALGVTPTPPSQPPQPADGVTLITGDRVVIVGRGHRIIPGPGRTEVVFASRTRDGHLHVTPSDAQPLIAKGVLDPRLFDVTQLLQWRYGDADTPDIPLITRSENGPAPALGSARGLRRLDGLGMAAFHLPKNGAAQAWKDLAGGRTLAPATAKIWLDGRRSFSLDRSTAQIGAPEAWKQGLTGKDVTVAVLDSGYDPDHPDLKGVVTQERNFSEDPDIRDTLGHGTHVASIVAGNGEKYRGVAPGARLAIGKVGGELGPSDSAVLAGMEWAAREVKAKIVNMSLGYDDQPGIDPVEEAVNTLSAETGTLFVVAAGNDGGSLPVSSPAGADAALAVGAVDRRDQVAYFSSLGPRIGDHAVKPDLTAPGTDIVAAAAQGTADGPHVAASGTSMASPHVAGAAAILAQRHPDWTGQRLKAALVGSARPTSGATPYQQGTGRVDVVRALRQQVTAQSEGTWAAFPWKGPDGREKTGTITYANAGETPVSLDLTVEGTCSGSAPSASTCPPEDRPRSRSPSTRPARPRESTWGRSPPPPVTPWSAPSPARTSNPSPTTSPSTPSTGRGSRSIPGWPRSTTRSRARPWAWRSRTARPPYGSPRATGTSSPRQRNGWTAGAPSPPPSPRSRSTVRTSA